MALLLSTLTPIEMRIRALVAQFQSQSALWETQVEKQSHPIFRECRRANEARILLVVRLRWRFVMFTRVGERVVGHFGDRSQVNRGIIGQKYLQSRDVRAIKLQISASRSDTKGIWVRVAERKNDFTHKVAP